MSLDINTVGSEFVKSVLKLYRSEKYFREKEILSKKLLDAATEAGSYITELGYCPEEREGEVADKAMSELGRAMFFLKVMSDEGIYPKRKVQPVIDMSREVKELIEPYMKKPSIAGGGYRQIAEEVENHPARLEEHASENTLPAPENKVSETHEEKEEVLPPAPPEVEAKPEAKPEEKPETAAAEKPEEKVEKKPEKKDPPEDPFEREFEADGFNDIYLGE